MCQLRLYPAGQQRWPSADSPLVRMFMSLSCGFAIINTLPNYVTSTFVVSVATYDSLVQFLHSH